MTDNYVIIVKNQMGILSRIIGPLDYDSAIEAGKDYVASGSEVSMFPLTSP